MNIQSRIEKLEKAAGIGDSRLDSLRKRQAILFATNHLFLQAPYSLNTMNSRFPGCGLGRNPTDEEILSFVEKAEGFWEKEKLSDYLPWSEAEKKIINKAYETI